MNFITKSPTQTKKLGEILAKEGLKIRKKKRGWLLGLRGGLGGGKTTFLQGFARGLGIKKKILSPTFLIMKKFQVSGSSFQYFYHIDCYRIQKPKEILSLDFKKIISDPKNIVAIEWSDRIKRVLPKDILTIKFNFLDKTKREISLE
jgi:tRNA threonylcarbamoyladenosine biosynthesis protein TsaE